MKIRLRLLLTLLSFVSLAAQSTMGQTGGIPNNWQNIRDLDTGIVGAISFSIGTKAWIITGDTSEKFGVTKKYSNSIYEYDSATNAWSMVGKYSPVNFTPRVGASVMVLNGKAYFGLGKDTTGFMDYATFNNKAQWYFRQRYLNDWYEFDPGSKTITAKAPFPGGNRGFANGTALKPANGKGVVAFGEGVWVDPADSNYKSKFYNDLWEYDANANTWTQLTTCPCPPRSNAVFTAIDNGKVVGGLGDTGNFGIYFRDWWEYDRTGNSWLQKNNYPANPKVNASTFSFANVVYVVGGFDGQWSKDFYEYDGSSDNWQRYPDYKDSGRYQGVSWMIGRMGYYGAGYRGNSEELTSLSKFLIDTNTIRVTSDFPDTICAGDILTVRWSTGMTFTGSNYFKVQMSDSLGLFVWPPVGPSVIDSFAITGAQNGQFPVTVPKNVLEGRKYRIRILSFGPYLLGRASDTFYVKSNPQFAYDGNLHPLQDTVCAGSNFFIPGIAYGSASRTNGTLTYQWRRNGALLSDNATYSGTNRDTLFITDMQTSHAGDYDLVVVGDCYPDTSEKWKIAVVNIPPPTITFQPTDTMAFDTTYICENAPFSLRVDATGSHVNYEWYFNGKVMQDAASILGLGTNKVDFLFARLVDSGWYKIRVYEDCGATVFTDSFLVMVRPIPRIITEPANVWPAQLEGTAAGFKVEASGFDLKYQWRKGPALLNNGPRYSGVNTDTFTISNIKLTDVDFYSVIVTGGCPPPDTSNLAVLEIDAVQIITRHPRDTAELCENSSTSINVLADGANLGYQWKHNNAVFADGGARSGSTTRILEFDRIQLTDAGKYTCDVDNGAGYVITSNPCEVVVHPKPATPSVTKVGPILQCSVICDAYIWFYNGRYQPQYTTRSITVPPTDEGDYQVRVMCKGCVSDLSEPTAYYLSVFENNNQPLDLYPNPASDLITLSLPGLNEVVNGKIQVTDLSGKVVISKEATIQSNVELNIQTLAKGMYVVNILVDQQMYTAKFIKQ